MRIQFSRGIAVLLLFVTIPTQSASASTLETQFASLLVADEVNNGYDRNLFPHWIDADKDGCNARYEVLIAEAIIAPSIDSGCRLTGGKWISIYDNKQFTNPILLDVDHFVPLAEAWRSGAWNWTQAKRTAFANDLDLPQALVAVSRGSNRSKSDSDVANWLPSNLNIRCNYLTSWVQVKAKWNLRVDLVERNAIENGLLQCGLLSSRTDPKFAKPESKVPNLQPTITRYQNCTSARTAGVTPIRRDQNAALYRVNTHLDRDKDGVACE